MRLGLVRLYHIAKFERAVQQYTKETEGSKRWTVSLFPQQTKKILAECKIPVNGTPLRKQPIPPHVGVLTGASRLFAVCIGSSEKSP